MYLTSSRPFFQCSDVKNSVTVAWNILTMATILGPTSLPAVYHSMFTVPNVAIGNSMACHVYRDIKFGRISSTRTTMPAHSSMNTLPPFLAARNINHDRRIVINPYGMETELESSQDAVRTPTYSMPTPQFVYGQPSDEPK
jgi:hypothetical protein